MEKLKLFNPKTGDYIVISQEYQNSIISITGYFITRDGRKIKYTQYKSGLFDDVYTQARFLTSSDPDYIQVSKGDELQVCY